MTRNAVAKDVNLELAEGIARDSIYQWFAAHEHASPNVEREFADGVHLRARPKHSKGARVTVDLIPTASDVVVQATIERRGVAAMFAAADEERIATAAASRMMRIRRLHSEVGSDSLTLPRTTLGRRSVPAILWWLKERGVDFDDRMSLSEILDDCTSLGCMPAGVTIDEMTDDIELLIGSELVTVFATDESGRPTGMYLRYPNSYIVDVVDESMFAGPESTTLLRMLVSPQWDAILAVLRGEVVTADDLTAWAAAAAPTLPTEWLFSRNALNKRPDGRLELGSTAIQLARAAAHLPASRESDRVGREVAAVADAEAAAVSAALAWAAGQSSADTGFAALTLHSLVDHVRLGGPRNQLVEGWLNALRTAAQLDPATWAPEALRAHAEAAILHAAWGGDGTDRTLASLVEFISDPAIQAVLGTETITILGVQSVLQADRDIRTQANRRQAAMDCLYAMANRRAPLPSRTLAGAPEIANAFADTDGRDLG